MVDGSFRAVVAPTLRSGHADFKVRATSLLPVVAHLRRVGIRIRAEVPQHHQRLVLRRIFDGDALHSGFVGTEKLIFRHFSKADHGRAVDGNLPMRPAPWVMINQMHLYPSAPA